MKPINTGYIFIMSDNGEIVYHPEAKFLRQNYRDVYADLVKKDGIADKIARGERVHGVTKRVGIPIGDCRSPAYPCISVPPKTLVHGDRRSRKCGQQLRGKLIEISGDHSLMPWWAWCSW